MSTEIVEELVMAKKQLEYENQQLLSLIGSLAMSNGSEKGTAYELRVSKAALNKVADRRVTIRGLKPGGAVITVRRQEE